MGDLKGKTTVTGRELSEVERDEKLHAILGINLFNEHFRKFTKTDIFLKNVHMTDIGVVCVTLSGLGMDEGTIAMWSADDESRSQYFSQTEKLRFSYYLDEGDKFNHIYDYFIKYLCVRLRDASIDVITECLGEERIKEWLKTHTSNSNEVRKKYFGNPEQWRSFKCQRALDRNISGLVRIIDPVATVHHGELECRYATLGQGIDLTYFFNYPWSRQPEGLSRKGRGIGNYDTDLTEMDMIMGPRNKLESVLETVADNMGEADMLWINTTCVSDVVGDDFEDITSRMQSSCGIPVFCSGPKTNEIMKAFSIMIEKYRGGDVGGRESQVLPRSVVNLLGFPCIKGTDEMLRYLDEMGVNINVRMLPELAFRDLGKVADTGINILYPLSAFEEFYDAVLEGVEAKRIREPAPYGMEKTKQWLKVVAKETGTTRQFNSLWKRSFGSVEERWSSLRAAAAEFRLAFVVDKVDLECLLNDDQNFSIDPLNFIMEMGFGVKLLLFADSNTRREELAYAALAPDGCDTAIFSNKSELSALLKEGDIHAVYSDYFFDDRIANAGKPQFSLNNFEMGIHGALRTVEALLRVCRLPFYGRFRKYIGVEVSQQNSTILDQSE